MPELRCGTRAWPVEAGSNLLDALNGAGLGVPYSCRAGHCQACLVRCTAGEPLDAQPEALTPERRAAGWRLACQCRVVDDLAVETFDPLRDGAPARVARLDWPAGRVLRLWLEPERPLRYRPGQHLLLWTAAGVARPYSLASLPGEEPWLEFHIDCSAPGAFSQAAQALQVGDELRLGALASGALRYEPEWAAQPLWLLAGGTGLAPLWALLRQALAAGHQGPLRVLHASREAHYLSEPLQALAAAHDNLQVELLRREQLDAALAVPRLQARQLRALVCGPPAFVEACSRRLYMQGVPRGQILADAFLTHAEAGQR
ncbi:iron-sulfur-binding ferredoxin reductase [Stutzerimonas azotifigens]|uniref:iron-sulfur-binding ferredoxin reductase n=1 Tax=Stutzerimonas azotifigens TaxID=291995 RepID=UPI00042A7803|nr:iron-sulfur-binding ferredoxin reductase [Stutzerimonas azotifigens]